MNGHTRRATQRIAGLPRFVSGWLVALAGVVVTPAYAQSYTQLSAGEYHSCAVFGSGGGVHCWGANDSGQANPGSLAMVVGRPTTVTGINGATQVSAGGNHSCALVAGNVKCWGENVFSQLGTGAGSGDRNAPVVVAGLIAFRYYVARVTTGNRHSCALMEFTLTNARSVRCWGYNDHGQIGDGTTTTRPTPVTVTGFTNPTAISAGADRTCAVADGGIWCWGYDSLLNGSSLTPTLVVSGAGLNVSATGREHACALFVGTASAACWGNNLFHGALGSVDPLTHGPVYTNSKTYSSISAGGFHTCAVDGGAIDCWGAGELGQLGDGHVNGGFHPAKLRVFGISNAATVAAGHFHTCALLADGAVQCWGSNQYGQLGYETNLDFSVTAGAIDSQPCSLDIDGDGSISATTDLILMARVIRGTNPNAVPNSVVGANATYQTPTEILSRMSACGVIYGP